MSTDQLRNSDGRFANGFGRTADYIMRSGADRYQRILLDDVEPLSWMGDTAGDGAKYLYAAAIRGLVRWFPDTGPMRRVEVEYVDPGREHIVVREAPGRIARVDGRVRIESVEWDEIPRRIAVAPADRQELDADESEHEAFGDALRAHEEVLGR